MILTPRLRLRALAARDLALFRKLFADAETMRHIGRPLSAREVEPSFRTTLAATRSPRGPWFFTIVKKRQHAGIGLCSIRNLSLRWRHAELGIMLRRDARGNGYARESFAALIGATFRALPIDTVWVQYRPANTATARLFDTLGFAADAGWRARNANRSQCVRILRRSDSQPPSNQSDRGHSMSNIIGFLESAGRNAAMRHASREQLLGAMQRSAIDGLLGVRETMYCDNRAVTPPKKAPAKKRPAEKTPAKKPAKKAPTKRR